MSYTAEEKQEIVELLVENNGAINKVSRQYGISKQTIYNWIEAGDADIVTLLERAAKTLLLNIPDYTKPGNAHSWPNALTAVLKYLMLAKGDVSERIETKNDGDNFDKILGLVIEDLENE